jgi:hypothetical protein
MTWSRRKAIHWMAILAILLNALVPAASQAFDPKRGVKPAPSQWLEVCVAEGTQWLRLADDGSVIEQTRQRPADAPVTTHKNHCSYCVTHAGSVCLAPEDAQGVHVWAVHSDIAPPRGASPRPKVAWRAPAARAPPSPV